MIITHWNHKHALTLNECCDDAALEVERLSLVKRDIRSLILRVKIDLMLLKALGCILGEEKLNLRHVGQYISLMSSKTMTDQAYGIQQHRHTFYLNQRLSKMSIEGTKIQIQHTRAVA